MSHAAHSVGEKAAEKSRLVAANRMYEPALTKRTEGRLRASMKATTGRDTTFAVEKHR